MYDLGGGFQYVLCSPQKLGKIPHFDEHIFRMGWEKTTN